MYTYKDVRQTFNPQAKSWTLWLSRFSQETFNGRRGRSPFWSEKEIFASYVNDKLADERLTPEVNR